MAKLGTRFPLRKTKLSRAFFERGERERFAVVTFFIGSNLFFRHVVVKKNGKKNWTEFTCSTGPLVLLAKNTKLNVDGDPIPKTSFKLVITLAAPLIILCNLAGPTLTLEHSGQYRVHVGTGMLFADIHNYRPRVACYYVAIL